MHAAPPLVTFVLPSRWGAVGCCRLWLKINVLCELWLRNSFVAAPNFSGQCSPSTVFVTGLAQAWTWITSGCLSICREKLRSFAHFDLPELRQQRQNLPCAFAECSRECTYQRGISKLSVRDFEVNCFYLPNKMRLHRACSKQVSDGHKKIRGQNSCNLHAFHCCHEGKEWYVISTRCQSEYADILSHFTEGLSTYFHEKLTK